MYACYLKHMYVSNCVNGFSIEIVFESVLLNFQEKKVELIAKDKKQLLDLIKKYFCSMEFETYQEWHTFWETVKDIEKID